MADAGIQINGRFEKWVMGIVATLIAGGVVAMIVLAIQVGQISTSIGFMQGDMSEIKRLVTRNDERLDALERTGR